MYPGDHLGLGGCPRTSRGVTIAALDGQLVTGGEGTEGDRVLQQPTEVSDRIVPLTRRGNVLVQCPREEVELVPDLGGCPALSGESVSLDNVAHMPDVASLRQLRQAPIGRCAIVVVIIEADARRAVHDCGRKSLQLQGPRLRR